MLFWGNYQETHSKANSEIVFSLCGFCIVWALLCVANRNSVHSNVEGNFYHICHPSMLVLYNYHLIKIPAFWQVCCAFVNRWICERMIGSFTAIIAVYSCLPALLRQTCQSIILRSMIKEFIITVCHCLSFESPFYVNNFGVQVAGHKLKFSGSTFNKDDFHEQTMNRPLELLLKFWLTIIAGSS